MAKVTSWLHLINVEAIKDLVDSYHVYDNQNGLTLIASNSYIHPNLYTKFLKKGGMKYHAPLTTTEKRDKMFDITPDYFYKMKKRIYKQKRKQKAKHRFIDDQDNQDILDRKYPD
jgi:hypothetical protein